MYVQNLEFVVENEREICEQGHTILRKGGRGPAAALALDFKLQVQLRNHKLLNAGQQTWQGTRRYGGQTWMRKL